MPRNGSGTYTLPAGNPVSSGTLIEASWANSTLSDLATAITDSLSRNGEGGMLAPLRFADGTVSAPGVAWTNETSTGFYRSGTGDMRVSLQGVDVSIWNSTGLTIPSAKALSAQGNATVGGTLGVTGVLTATGGVTGNVTGNASTATTLQTARNINGVSFNGSANIDVNTVNAVTFNSAGSGDASGTTFNGSAARTISYNTVGAPSTTGTNATGTWSINVTGNAGTVTNGVYTTGNQTIAGTNTFSGSIVLNNSQNFQLKDSGGTSRNFFTIGGDNIVSFFNSGNNTVRILNQSGASPLVTLTDASGNFSATGNVTASGGTVTIGSSALAPTGSAPSYTPRAWANFDLTPASGTYSRSGTTVSIAMTSHGMSSGMVASLTFSAGTGGTATSGSYVITVLDANNFTVTDSVSGTITGSPSVTRNLYIRSRGNVSSIDKVGTGEYTINFSTALPDEHYVVTGSCSGSANHPVLALAVSYAVAPTASAVRILTATTGGSGSTGFVSEGKYVHVSILR